MGNRPGGLKRKTGGENIRYYSYEYMRLEVLKAVSRFLKSSRA
jgi:hypothetical protein